MTQIRVAEFKAKLSEYLRAVRHGRELTIYDRDHPIARVVPVTQQTPLVVREPVTRYGTLGQIELPPPLALPADIVDDLLADRASRA
jgi:prevent-host-death family protein